MPPKLTVPTFGHSNHEDHFIVAPALSQNAVIALCFSSQPVITSQMGTVNNIIQVKKTDFEVFDALMVDSQKCSDMSGQF